MRNMLIKSIFIMTYITCANVIGLYGLYQYVQTLDIIWLGVTLANLPGGMFFNYLVLFQPMARTSKNMPVVVVLVVIGMALTVYGVLQTSVVDPLTLLLAAVGSVGWLLYDFWYSRYHRYANHLLQVGEKLPEFTIDNEKGESIESKQFLGKPALFIFYRGNWCPFCMAQIKEVANQYQALSKRGVQIAVVSPQSHKQTQKLAKKFDVPMSFLVDVDNKVATQLGLLAKNGLPTGMQALGYDSDTVMATVLMTNQQGALIFADLTDNYRIRPEPATFLQVLDAQPA